RRDGLVLEEARGLPEIAHKDEGAGAREELLRGVGKLEHEERRGADRVRDVAQDDEPGLVAPATPARRLKRDARGAQALAERSVGIDAAPQRSPPPDALGAAEAFREAAHGATDLLDFGLGERAERGVGDAPRSARVAFAEAARERLVDMLARAP